MKKSGISVSLVQNGLRWTLARDTNNTYDDVFRPAPALKMLTFNPAYEMQKEEKIKEQQLRRFELPSPQPPHPMEMELEINSDGLSTTAQAAPSISPPPPPPSVTAFTPDLLCTLNVSRDGRKLRVPQNCVLAHVEALLHQQQQQQQPAAIEGVTYVLGNRSCLCGQHGSALVPRRLTSPDITQLLIATKAFYLLVMVQDTDRIHLDSSAVSAPLKIPETLQSIKLMQSALYSNVAPVQNMQGRDLEIISDVRGTIREELHIAYLIKYLQLFAMDPEAQALRTLRLELTRVDRLTQRAALALYAATAATTQILSVFESGIWERDTEDTDHEIQKLLNGTTKYSLMDLSVTAAAQTLSITLNSASQIMLRHAAATVAFLSVMREADRKRLPLMVGPRLTCVLLRLIDIHTNHLRLGFIAFLSKWITATTAKRQLRLFVQVNVDPDSLTTLMLALCGIKVPGALHVILMARSHKEINVIIDSLTERPNVQANVFFYTAVDFHGNANVADVTITPLTKFAS